MNVNRFAEVLNWHALSSQAGLAHPHRVLVVRSSDALNGSLLDMHSGLDHWSLLLFFSPLGCGLGVSLSHSVEGGVELVKVLRNSSHECFDLRAVLLDSSHLSVSVEANVSCFLNDCL